MSLIRVAHLELSGDGDSLEVGQGLRVLFETYAATKSGGKPSTVQVYNLSQETISRIMDGMNVSLIAGYDDDNGVTDQGAVTRSRTFWTGRERITEIQIQPAAQIAAASAKFEMEYPEGPIQLRQIVQDCLSALGTTATSLDAIPDVTVDDFQAAGSAKRTLERELKQHMITWSQRLGEVVFYPVGAPVPGAATHQVSETSGLIGSPAPSEQGATIMVHFDRTILVGDVLSLESRDVSGSFKAVKVEHSGDTYGNQAWSTKIEGQEVAA